MLYVVSTPIGNLEDITLRALRILKECDIVACEDTRVTKKLFSLLNLPMKQFIAYHDYSTLEIRQELVKLLEEGKNIALVSDAGTPLISDPGYKLVQLAYQKNIKVTSVPGANAVLTALQLSTFPSDKFFFGGFLPKSSGERKRVFSDLKDLSSTLIFYETAPRLSKTLQDVYQTLGNRKIVVARELTKKFEEIICERVLELQEKCTANLLKGEIVLLIAYEKEENGSDEKIKDLLKEELKKMSVKQASEKVSILTGVSKKKVYKWALELK